MKNSDPKPLTVKSILAKTIKRGSCRIWTGMIGSNGGPMVYDPVLWANSPQVAGKRTRSGNRSPRVALWEIRNGPMPAGHRLLMTCVNSHCIERDHTRLVTQSEFVKAHAARGAYKTLAHKVASLANGRKGGKVTPEMAQLIRERMAAGMTSTQAVKDLPIAESTARAVNAGKLWARKLAPNASVFSQAA